jgi:hypothetical protein
MSDRPPADGRCPSLREIPCGRRLSSPLLFPSARNRGAQRRRASPVRPLAGDIATLGCENAVRRGGAVRRRTTRLDRPPAVGRCPPLRQAPMSAATALRTGPPADRPWCLRQRRNPTIRATSNRSQSLSPRATRAGSDASGPDCFGTGRQGRQDHQRPAEPTVWPVSPQKEPNHACALKRRWRNSKPS